MLRCSSERPWGLHETIRNDEDCPRCGWTAPGPLGDAREAAAEARARAQALGWTVHDGLGGEAVDEALAA